MTYAYVTSETCRRVSAEKPGVVIGREGVPVSKHGDYERWECGKFETARIIQSHLTAANAHRQAAAQAVAELLGWFPMGDNTYRRAGR